MTSFNLPPSLLAEITAACGRDQVVLARLRGFAEGKGLDSPFRLELSGRIVVEAIPTPAGKNGKP